MIAGLFAETLRDKLMSIHWVDRYGGLTQLVMNDIVKVPVSESENLNECFDNNHYKELIPEGSKEGIVYIEEVTDEDIKKGTHGLYSYGQRLRLVAWINLKAAGYVEYDVKPFWSIYQTLLNEAAPVHLLEGIKIQNITNVKRLKKDDVINNVFGRYKYQNDLYALCSYPFGVFAMEFDLIGLINPGVDSSCLPGTEGPAETPEDETE